MMNKQLGQSMMIMSIILALLMVSAIGYSLTLSNKTNTDLTNDSRRQAQSYYLAKAGIDEALATRLIPRSNQLNFRTGFPGTPTYNNGPIVQANNGSLQNGTASAFGGPYTALPWFTTNTIYPFYLNSGMMSSDITDPASPVFGVYRYMVLGGDPARKAADGSYYNLDNAGDYNPALKGPAYSQLLENEYFRNDGTPFVIVSNGLACVRPANVAVAGLNPQGGTVQTGALQFNPGNPLTAPTCPAGTVLDQTTMVMPISMEVMDPVALNTAGNPQRIAMSDRTGALRVFKGANFRMPDNFDSTPMSLFVPGYPALQATNANVNFQQMWAANTNTSPRLSAVVFFDSATRQLIGKPVVFCRTSLADCPAGFSDSPTKIVVGGNSKVLVNLDPATNPAGGFPVSSTASFKLFFDGPIDYRAPYNYYINGTFANNTGQQTNGSIDRQILKIHMDGSSALLDLRDFNFLTLFPSNTQVLVSPTYQANALNRLIMSGMRDYAGNPDGVGGVPRTYDIKFKVN